MDAQPSREDGCREFGRRLRYDVFPMHRARKARAEYYRISAHTLSALSAPVSVRRPRTTTLFVARCSVWPARRGRLDSLRPLPTLRLSHPGLCSTRWRAEPAAQWLLGSNTSSSNEDFCRDRGVIGLPRILRCDLICIHARYAALLSSPRSADKAWRVLWITPPMRARAAGRRVVPARRERRMFKLLRVPDGVPATTSLCRVESPPQSRPQLFGADVAAAASYVTQVIWPMVPAT